MPFCIDESVQKLSLNFNRFMLGKVVLMLEKIILIMESTE